MKSKPNEMIRSLTLRTERNILITSEQQISPNFSREVETIASVIGGAFVVAFHIFNQLRLERLINRTIQKTRTSVEECMINLFFLAKGGVAEVNAVTNFDPADAKNKIEDLRVTLARFNELKQKVEETPYLNTPEIRKRTQLALSSLYDMEIALKRRAYPKGRSKNERTNRDLVEGMALSSKSIASKLASNN